MKTLQELLINRRSTREFLDEPLTPKQVYELLQAALLSPASKSTNEWSFVVVDDKNTLEALSRCKQHGAKMISKAPLAIVVCADPRLNDVWIEDASIASILIQLQAEDLGLGSCWVQLRNRLNESGFPAEDYVRDLLNIPTPHQILSIIAIGKKAKERAPHNVDKLEWEKVHLGRWRSEE
ncbi:MAG: nitroreductase family protein [Bacteroidales bacterium]